MPAKAPMAASGPIDLPSDAIAAMPAVPSKNIPAAASRHKPAPRKLSTARIVTPVGRAISHLLVRMRSVHSKISCPKKSCRSGARCCRTDSIPSGERSSAEFRPVGRNHGHSPLVTGFLQTPQPEKSPLLCYADSEASSSMQAVKQHNGPRTELPKQKPPFRPISNRPHPRLEIHVTHTK